MTYELLIQHNGVIMLPPVVESVSIEWERQGQPGKLTAEVVKTPGLSFQEGDPCRFSVDGTPLFYGFVFEKSRKGSTDEIIQITVYDQLYYLKNKDTYVYSGKTATAVLRMIAEDFQLNVGSLEDTGYVIGSRVEDNHTLFDIIQNALDETLKATSQMYVLYDDVGKLTLKNIGSMKLGLLIDEETAGDFDYKSSIASQTYDKVKLCYENQDTGQREIFVAQDSANINQWGVLQYYEKLDSTTNGRRAAGALQHQNPNTQAEGRAGGLPCSSGDPPGRHAGPWGHQSLQLPHGGTGQAQLQQRTAPYGPEYARWYVCHLT